MNTDSVSLIEILAAARRQHASLVVESTGYLLLAISRGMGGLAVDVDPANVMLRTDGALTLTGPRARCAADKAANNMRHLAARLLDVSIGKSLGLRAAIRPAEEGKNPLDRLNTGVTKALIPINRGAAKRALARLARETIRAKKRGQLRPQDVQQEAEETAAAFSVPLASATAAPPSARPVSEPSPTPSPFARPSLPHPDFESVAPPGGLAELDIDVDLELVTPTPDPMSLELRTLTPPPVAVAVRVTAPVDSEIDATTAVVNLPQTPTGSESMSLGIHDRVTATNPDDFAAKAAQAAHGFDEPPAFFDEPLRDDDALMSDEGEEQLQRSAAAPDETDEEPDVLEEFRIQNEQDEIDAELQSDVSALVQCALKQIDDLDMAEDDFSPLQASAHYTPSPTNMGGPEDDSSVEAMLDGFGGDGLDEAIQQAASSLQDMAGLKAPEATGTTLSRDQKTLDLLNDVASREGVQSLTPPPSFHAAEVEPTEPPATPSIEEPSPSVLVEFEDVSASLVEAAVTQAPEQPLIAEPHTDELRTDELHLDEPHPDESHPDEPVSASPNGVSRAYVHDDSWLGEDPDAESEGHSIPPTFITQKPRTPRSPMILSALLLLTGLGAAGVLWKKPELYQQLKARGIAAVTTPAEGVCYAPLDLRDLPARHEVLLHVGEVGSEPLAVSVPTGVRVDMAITSTKHQTTRLVLAKDDEWQRNGGKLQHQVSVELKEGVTATWPSAPDGQVGGVGPAGLLTVTSPTAGAEVWMVLTAGVGETAKISVPCDSAARLLVVDTSSTLRQRQLHVQSELLRAASRAGGGELSGKI